MDGIFIDQISLADQGQKKAIPPYGVWGVNGRAGASSQWAKHLLALPTRALNVSEIRFPDSTVQLWSPLDRLVFHWIYRLIKPTFQHVISTACLHLKGPSAIKTGRCKRSARKSRKTVLRGIRV